MRVYFVAKSDFDIYYVFQKSAECKLELGLFIDSDIDKLPFHWIQRTPLPTIVAVRQSLKVDYISNLLRCTAVLRELRKIPNVVCVFLADILSLTSIIEPPPIPRCTLFGYESNIGKNEKFQWTIYVEMEDTFKLGDYEKSIYYAGNLKSGLTIIENHLNDDRIDGVIFSSEHYNQLAGNLIAKINEIVEL